MICMFSLNSSLIKLVTWRQGIPAFDILPEEFPLKSAIRKVYLVKTQKHENTWSPAAAPPFLLYAPTTRKSLAHASACYS